MGFNQTAVKTAVKEIGSGGEGAFEPPDELELQLEDAGLEAFEQLSRQPRAVLCGSYRRGVPSLLRAYEKLSTAGVRVLSPSGFDFLADIDGFVLTQDEVGVPPEVTDRLRLNCIRTADLVWLHAPDGYVELSGASEIGFANAAGVPVYADELPSDVALRSLVTVSTLDHAIAETGAGERGNPGASSLPRQGYYSAMAREPGYGRRSAHDVMRLITEEIGELARQRPGQRQRRLRTSKSAAASSG
jgi:hypothetical protein